MNKTLVLFLVATLLLAGCTELTESEDGETLKIEVNEDIAIEKIADFITVDEGESFGITMMYDMDPSMMGLDEGMLEVDEDSEAVITIEMTQAWSPNGYHTSEVMGLVDSGAAIKYVTSVTHIDTTLYFEMGYETVGDMCADEETAEDTEMCEMMFGEMPAPQSYSMATTTTHTEVIAAMAEETSSNSDDMDPLEMLEFFTFVECFGTFTPADSVDGLQIFDVAMEGMDDDSISPMMALCISDSDESGGVSFEEFIVVDETDQEDMATMQSKFSDADTNSDDELTLDELGAFIEAVDAHYEGMDNGDDGEDGLEDDGPVGMPNMAVAFNSAGEIEYFEMQMDEMGDELTMMKIYVLTDDKVNSLFTNVDAGELVALPFDIVDYMPFGSNEEFMCDDGSTIPMDYVNDGDEDCVGGEDEMDMGEGDVEMFYMCERFIELATYEASSDDFDTMYADSFDSSICGTAVDVDAEADIDATTPTMPTEFVLEECEEMTLETGETVADCELITIQVIDNLDTGVQELYGSFEETDSENCEGDYDETTMTCTELYGEVIGSDDNTISIQMSFGVFFQCADGSESIDLTWVNDGMDDCADGSDESSYDANGEDTMGFTCLDGTVIPLDYVLDNEEDCTGGEDEMPYMEMNFWFDYQYDETTGSGLMVFAEEVYYDEETEMVCYDFNTHSVDESIDNQADCEYAGYMWTEDQSDDHGDDSDDEIVWYITNEMDFHFEGDMSDYKIELATCEDDYDMDTGEETKTCTTVMSVAVGDSSVTEVGGIMFHDADSSGTISVGDMIHIGDVEQDWNDVRLYSISADAYSDENPMHNAPGFTGLVGMLALLGAAFIRRNE